MLGKEFLADARLVIKTVHAGFGGDLGQVAIAFVGLSEYAEMVVGVAFGRPAMVVFFADVKLASDDGLDAGLLSGFSEVKGSKDVAVIGYGDSRHIQCLGARNQLLDIAGPIQERVIRMQM